MARFLSFWPSASWNWWLNRGMTFSERQGQPRARQWAKFVLSSLLGLGANVGVYTVLTSYVDIFARHRLLAFCCGVGLGGIVNFLISNLYVYRLHSTSKHSP